MGRARCCRSSMRAAWRRPPASRRTWRTWRSSSRRSSARGARGGAQIVSTGSLREMHRVRSVEENWTSGTGLGFDINRIKRQDLRRPWRRLSRQHDADVHSARRQGRRHRAHEHERLQPRRHRAAVDGHRRARRSPRRRRRSRRRSRGIRRGRGSPASIAGEAATRRSCCSTRSS